MGLAVYVAGCAILGSESIMGQYKEKVILNFPTDVFVFPSETVNPVNTDNVKIKSIKQVVNSVQLKLSLALSVLFSFISFFIWQGLFL